ncbi:WYL domain-containing protein [Paenibacillus timonensis]|uniref:Helix-turn-helix transcriptional regulator n=1 Tax=Paenibacillus timonensis TaxID=225915 RepID=A0ABW3SCU9_9BACL|nr:WYL domain-containing protein [Paenibacillus timonensis]MCH1640964.1 WYL domain-containing protein [Paenibacillus timonensis]
MKRMDRMMAIVMALQQRAETAQSLADRLEVSKRTVLRDMQALTEIGIPLIALSGPGGGYRLMDGFRLPPLQLDAGEALTVLLALDGMGKYGGSPFREAKWTVADKIRSALPEQMLGQIAPLLRHVEMEVPERGIQAPFLSALMGYAAGGKWIRAEYRSMNYRRQLTLKPLRVYAAHGFWYCEAESLEHGEKRTFRVDRFVEAAETSPPPDACTDRGAEAKKGDTPAAADFRLQVILTYRGSLLAEQDPHFGQKVQQTGEEEWRLDCLLPGTEWDWAVAYFFALGRDAEVLEPQTLREELHRRAVELAELYRT